MYPISIPETATALPTSLAPMDQIRFTTRRLFHSCRRTVNQPATRQQTRRLKTNTTSSRMTSHVRPGVSPAFLGRYQEPFEVREPFRAAVALIPRRSLRPAACRRGRSGQDGFEGRAPWSRDQYRAADRSWRQGHRAIRACRSDSHRTCRSPRKPGRS